MIKYPGFETKLLKDENLFFVNMKIGYKLTVSKSYSLLQFICILLRPRNTTVLELTSTVANA